MAKTTVEGAGQKWRPGLPPELPNGAADIDTFPSKELADH
jgi:hypothetical protein